MINNIRHLKDTREGKWQERLISLLLQVKCSLFFSIIHVVKAVTIKDQTEVEGGPEEKMYL